MYESLRVVAKAFSGLARPEHFTDYTHCAECADHDQTLQRHTPDSIGMLELGNPGWDPICYINAAAFRYYLPALARLVVESDGDYLDTFLFHLANQHASSFTPDQRQALWAFLVSADKARSVHESNSPTARLLQAALGDLAPS